ncbi:uncharacterized protein BJ171DRAFT_576375 [Polychytrium aggregatum]|uniref:uncharacterized protein n=1 Tax=Polychytrium aggregatum TaxID=110093 RepID=UPI0022FEB2E9|nr:uncharacterized protein BJ171DRAFT_576375 [Polychytrium aggregatum]KAI9209585.1 hypothetical protein BJ171DRAFT_576375 [Polychytrium aggregatum]
MKTLLSHLEHTSNYEIITFPEKTILNEPIESWPRVHFLITFHSSDFPLHKAVAYVRLRNPYVLNSPMYQHLLLDRRVVLAILDSLNIPTVPRIAINRAGSQSIPSYDADIVQEVLEKFGVDVSVSSSLFSPSTLPSKDGPILADGMLTPEPMCRPFVEKPVNSEDHNVHVYFKNNQGVQKLFRKVKNRSSAHSENCSIRTVGSYVYEQYLFPDNAVDVKVYAVGEHYVHAETRKSPVIDGVVERTPDGKEKRVVTALTPEETEIARRLTLAFEQTVCGFDLLRVNGKSYVIDVNGWSMVKGSDEYAANWTKVVDRLFTQAIDKGLIPSLVPTDSVRVPVPRALRDDASSSSNGARSSPFSIPRPPLPHRKSFSAIAQPLINVFNKPMELLGRRHSCDSALVVPFQNGPEPKPSNPPLLPRRRSIIPRPPYFNRKRQKTTPPFF